jgi:hypothetical protein
VRIKTAELTGAALDWAVLSITSGRVGYQLSHDYLKANRPSTDWSQGGPIIEREGIYLVPDYNGGWNSTTRKRRGDYSGPTPLIAAMRCFVASRLGDEVDVPEELLS